MTVGTLDARELRLRLNQQGLGVRLGPFQFRIHSDLPEFAALLRNLYQFYPLVDDATVFDSHVRIGRPASLRRFVRRQVSFSIDGRSPFAPYSVEHAFPAFEWGLNWCIATRAHQLLMLHSAVVERHGLAMLFPAWPGHGKSTLCTALAHSGWRLLSDEFGLIRPEDGRLLPIPRLIPLKNQSIEVISRFRPETHFGPSFFGTRKGTVAHVRPPAEAIRRANETAIPRWLVFPKWEAGAPLSLTPLNRSEAFLRVATNAFNYEVLEARAFRLVTDLATHCEAYSLVYSDLDEALAALDQMTEGAHA